MALRSWLNRLAAPGSSGASRRTTGPPTSSNGASSFHLTWDVPPVPLIEVAATFEVLEQPVVSELYFWALQVSFMQGPSRRGGAHFGLQYHPQYPNGGAVNWGGYQDAGGEIEGSVSDLPSALNNINTRTYPWQPNRKYRHRIYRSPDRGWRGSVTDLETGAETVVRDLWIEADAMLSPMVWSEVFADCDHPSSSIRWSDLDATQVDGSTFRTTSVRLNYQTFGDGGCANSNTFTDGGGFVQRTATERTNATGSRLTLSQ